ncbi:5-oxoprolinase subunit PxpA [Spongiibacter sp. KMU-158]|uniref:5-oxoprolinase subunit PxpA n=1 Tax=Spongiibacter pelagi TaxID=2760804 RepID=A0A927C5M3_9GAMM|nr:5-oxoprolinase subunit PxpA [Spongiibacter pelagi]MBD2859840.1 5-oxoprolinase subunit PxpA [Spongiibacter pelagi]
MKINCDMGEGFGAWQMGADDQLMPHIDMANIACGLHASDPVTMADCVALAVSHKVSIGAHPGYPDLLGFGRRDFPIEGKELESTVLYQLGALEGICRAHGAQLDYIKPHGALYNKMMRDAATFETLLNAVRCFNANLPLVIQAGSVEANARRREQADKLGVQLWFEAFADRSYENDGSLTPRTVEGAVHNSVEKIILQARQILNEGTVLSRQGDCLTLAADTLCLHGDNPLCVEAAPLIRS